MRVRPEAIITGLLFALSPCAAQERDPTFELVMALGDADATKRIHADASTAAPRLGMLRPRATAAEDPLEILAKDKGKAARARAVLRRIGL